MSALNTDLYELTMAAGYFAAGKSADIATFELLVRRLPSGRNFLVSAGVQQAVEYLLGLQFDDEEIRYLRSLAQFRRAPDEFWAYLSNLRFTGDLFAMPEGTPFFAGEPVIIVRAPLIQAQLVETFLLSTLSFQTSVASKAARCVIAAQGRIITEFGTRRAHSPYAGVLAGRAAFVGGCAGTSNAEAGMRFGIPVSGTAAHSWTMAFETERESFRSLQKLLGEETVFLVDTYDTLEGVWLAAQLGRPAWGIRLDSGDLNEASRRARQILDGAGLHDMKIMATNDLDEYRVDALIRGGAPIDAFGIGTQLATSADAPALSAVYKLVEIRVGQRARYTAKFSGEKSTLPGAKQVYRNASSDLITCYGECSPELKGEPLLQPVIANGQLVEPLPSLRASQEHARALIAKLPSPLLSIDTSATYKIAISPELLKLAETVRREHLTSQPVETDN